MSNCCCAAINCKNIKRKNSLLSFFRFPKEQKRCALWLRNCRRKDLDNIFKKHPVYLYDNLRLCGEHFEKSQFFTPAQTNRLKGDAVPTIFDVPNPPKLLEDKRPHLACRFVETSPVQPLLHRRSSSWEASSQEEFSDQESSRSRDSASCPTMYFTTPGPNDPAPSPTILPESIKPGVHFLQHFFGFDNYMRWLELLKKLDMANSRELVAWLLDIAKLEVEKEAKQKPACADTQKKQETENDLLYSAVQAFFKHFTKDDHKLRPSLQQQQQQQMGAISNNYEINADIAPIEVVVGNVDGKSQKSSLAKPKVKQAKKPMNEKNQEVELSSVAQTVNEVDSVGVFTDFEDCEQYLQTPTTVRTYAKKVKGKEVGILESLDVEQDAIAKLSHVEERNVIAGSSHDVEQVVVVETSDGVEGNEPINPSDEEGTDMFFCSSTTCL